jgi:DeoR/GlpR family transcriptional regulator of sugar metabolism
MLAITRLNEIRGLLRQNKSVLVSELAVRFGVTEETIRRDLKKLEDDGVATRVYGGAFSVTGVQNDINIMIREGVLIGEKKQIAANSLQFINSGDSIFLDCSTTALQLAMMLQDYALTVVTNSLKIADTLCTQRNIKLIVIGGRLDGGSLSFIGENASRALAGYYVDKAFVSCRSFSINNGISDSNEEQGAIRRIAIERSDEAYLLVDHTKIGATSFVHIADAYQLSAVVTDTALSPEWHRYLTENNVHIVENE